LVGLPECDRGKAHARLNWIRGFYLKALLHRERTPERADRNETFEAVIGCLGECELSPEKPKRGDDRSQGHSWNGTRRARAGAAGRNAATSPFGPVVGGASGNQRVTFIPVRGLR
jgi:hypothetical protein